MGGIDPEKLYRATLIYRDIKIIHASMEEPVVVYIRYWLILFQECSLAFDISFLTLQMKQVLDLRLYFDI